MQRESSCGQNDPTPAAGHDEESRKLVVGGFLEDRRQVECGNARLDPDVAELVHSTGPSLRNRPVFTSTSAENPLLGINYKIYSCD